MSQKKIATAKELDLRPLGKVIIFRDRQTKPSYYIQISYFSSSRSSQDCRQCGCQSRSHFLVRRLVTQVEKGTVGVMSKKKLQEKCQKKKSGKNGSFLDKICQEIKNSSQVLNNKKNDQLQSTQFTFTCLLSFHFSSLIFVKKINSTKRPGGYVHILWNYLRSKQ